MGWEKLWHPLPSCLCFRQYCYFGARHEAPVSGIEKEYRNDWTNKPGTLFKNCVPIDLSTPSWITMLFPNSCCASPFHALTCYSDFSLNDTGTRAWAQHFYELQSCEYLFLWTQCVHAVALGTGYVSVSGSLIIAPKDNLRSCLPFPREQDMSLYFHLQIHNPLVGLTA